MMEVIIIKTSTSGAKKKMEYSDVWCIDILPKEAVKNEVDKDSYEELTDSLLRIYFEENGKQEQATFNITPDLVCRMVQSTD